MKLKDKVGLVTGASQGIGRACAIQLAKAGATVALAARSVAKLEAVAAEITAAGGNAKVYALDVSSEESIKFCAKSVLADLGKVEILVNNAGITKDGLALRMRLSDFEAVLRTNLTGAFLCTRAAFRMMAAQSPSGGRIINNGSVSADRPRPAAAACPGGACSRNKWMESGRMDCVV